MTMMLMRMVGDASSVVVAARCRDNLAWCVNGVRLGRPLGPFLQPACAHMRVADGRRAAAEQRAGTGPWAMGAGWRGACCLLAGCPTNPLEDGEPCVNKQFHCKCASAVVVVVMVNLTPADKDFFLGDMGTCF